MTTPRPEPFYFGDPAQPLAGWIHRPAPASGSRLGVVLCPPLFHESLASHRTMRRLACAAAARGIPALRFDYRGCGNSSGTAADDDRLAPRIESIRSAIETVKSVGGVDQVCVLGMRMGASLAACATVGRTDVAAVVAIAPVVRGRKYLRELRAFAWPSTADEPWQDTADPNDAGGGFVLSSGTRAAIAALDLVALEGRIAPRVLLVDRNDLPSDGAWAAHLRQQGSAVDLWQMAGFADMMLDPHLSVVPADMVRTIVDWLADDCSPPVDSRQPAHDRRAAPRPSSMQIPAPTTDSGPVVIQETTRYLDADGLLFGVITQPARRAALTSGPPLVVMLLNAGAIHHIGPGRLYVALARIWAASGHVVLRMDLSGLGDSGARPGCEDNVVYSPRANDDIAAAVSFVRREYPGARVYLTGICSGAYHAFKAAVAGADIDGAIVINPLTFFWRHGMSFDAGPAQIIKDAARNRAAARHFDTWRRLLTGRIHLSDAGGLIYRRILALGVRRLREMARWLHITLPNDLAAELQRVAQRRIDLQFIFSSGDPGHQLLIEQGGSTVAALARRGALRVEIIDGADHVFTRQSSKDRLIATLTGEFAPRPARPVADAAPAAWRLHDQSAARHS